MLAPLLNLTVLVISPLAFEERFAYVRNQIVGPNFATVVRVFSNASSAVHCKGHKINRRTMNLLNNHILAWHRVQYTSEPCLILEDDVKIADTAFDTMAQQIPRLPRSTDIFWPGGCCCYPDHGPYRPPLYHHKFTACTQSYYLTPQGASHLLQTLSDFRFACAPADLFMNRVIRRFSRRVKEWNGFALQGMNLFPQNKDKFPLPTH